MRPVEVADEAVIAAGQALEAENRQVTGYALRKRLGGGSGARLSAVWAAHLEHRRVSQEDAMPELPVEVAEQLSALTKEITERLAVLARGMNDKAVKGAERRVTDLVRAVEEQRKQADREVVDADQAVTELEAALEQAHVANGEWEARHRDALAQVQAKDIELARLNERLSADTLELERLRAQAQQLTEARDRAQQEAEAGQRATAQAREEAANVRGENGALRTQNEQLLRALGKGG